MTCPVFVLFTLAAKSFLKASKYGYIVYIVIVLYVLRGCSFCIALAFHFRIIISISRDSVIIIFAKNIKCLKITYFVLQNTLPAL